MARFVYKKWDEGSYVELEAEEGEELPFDVVQTYALTQIGTGLDFIARAINGLSEEVRDFNSIRVELEK